MSTFGELVFFETMDGDNFIAVRTDGELTPAMLDALEDFVNRRRAAVDAREYQARLNRTEPLRYNQDGYNRILAAMDEALHTFHSHISEFVGGLPNDGYDEVVAAQPPVDPANPPAPASSSSLSPPEDQPYNPDIDPIPFTPSNLQETVAESLYRKRNAR